MSLLEKILQHSKRHFLNKESVPAVELKNLLIDFGGLTAVNSVNIKIQKGELVTLLGPSGCGKTTMLNAIAGLLTPSSGKIIFKGKDVTKLSPQKRKLGLVFQNYALYPHMNVYKNIAFPLTNDIAWKNGVSKKNDIAKLNINSIILKSNGANEKNLEDLEKSFFAIYDASREAELYINKFSSKGLEVYNTAYAKKTLVKPRYATKCKNINAWALKKLKTLTTKEERAELKKEIKVKISKAKNDYNVQNKKANIEVKKAKEDLRKEKFKKEFKHIKTSTSKAIKQAKKDFKFKYKNIIKEFSLKKNNLTGSDKKEIEKLQEKIISLKEAIHIAVMEVANKVDIVKNLQKLPTKLSGGQQQRVAIARGIVKNPDILLMDEPLSNLDAKLRIQTRNWIRKIQQELGITLIFVTHDQEEAMAISDKVVCLNGGDVQQIGTPLDLFAKPANEFVAKFLGMPEMKIMPTQVSSTGVVKLLGNKIAQVNAKYRKINIGLRAEDFIEAASNASAKGTILEIEYLGKEIRAVINFETFGQTSVILSKKDKYEIGQVLNFNIKPRHINLFDAKNGVRIDV